MVSVEASPDEWVVVRQVLSRGCAHLGAELAQIGSAGADSAAKVLAVIAAFEQRINQATSSDIADQPAVFGRY